MRKHAESFIKISHNETGIPETQTNKHAIKYQVSLS